MDNLIAEATSETNPKDNWSKIIEICDVANTSESSAREAVTLLAKRLSHKNANVVLFTLTVANALVQNCSHFVKAQICSRTFLDAVVKTLQSPSHPTVRQRILELLESWSNQFKSDSTLDYMSHVYQELKSQGYSFEKAPQSPVKKKHDEQDDIELAIALSLSEAQKEKQKPRKPAPQPTVTFNVRANYDFYPTEAGELRIAKGDVIQVLDDKTFPDWWKGSLNGQVGLFPSNHVERISDQRISDQPNVPLRTASLEDQKNKIQQFIRSCSMTHDMAGQEKLRQTYQEILDMRASILQKAEIALKKQQDLTALNEELNQSLSAYQQYFNR